MNDKNHEKNWRATLNDRRLNYQGPSSTSVDLNMCLLCMDSDGERSSQCLPFGGNSV